AAGRQPSTSSSAGCTSRVAFAEDGGGSSGEKPRGPTSNTSIGCSTPLKRDGPGASHSTRPPAVIGDDVLPHRIEGMRSEEDLAGQGEPHHPRGGVDGEPEEDLVARPAPLVHEERLAHVDADARATASARRSLPAPAGRRARRRPHARG